MEREMHALYESAIRNQRLVKSFRLFLLTDRRDDIFRSRIQPSKRFAKKLLKMCIKVEPLGIKRVYIAREDDILGDSPLKAPVDREVARDLAVPLAPIKDIVCKLFWAPDVFAGDARERLTKL